MRRYLQNNIDFLNTLIFNVFSIISPDFLIFKSGIVQISLFLGAKAPLGPLEQKVKVKVKVKVKAKKLRNSMILPKLLDDG